MGTALTFKMNRSCLLVSVLFVAWASAHVNTQKEFGDLDAEDNLDEDEFEELFDVKKADNPREEARRRRALKYNEYKVKKENEEFIEGKKPYWSQISDFDNLPRDEFLEKKTGLRKEEDDGYGRGFLPFEGPDDEESERYFDTLRYSREAVPEEYNSVEEGISTPVKNQKYCGSCVAFSNIAVIETCFKKLTGVEGDYSEQQLVDCGYGREGAMACSGAQPHTYLKLIEKEKWNLTAEATYPYRNTDASGQCPPGLKLYNQGAKVKKVWYTRRGTEDLMKKLVYKHGAVTTGVYSKGYFKRYGGGIFQQCWYRKEDHAITVVGYGVEKGKKYWLLKNSWGTGWGEKGYMRIYRGNSMCGIGQAIVTATCESVPGPTDATITTPIPCVDKNRKCRKLAKTNCARVAPKCTKSCGLCKGMTPHISNTCPDKWEGCPKFAETMCGMPEYAKGCCMSCGLGEGMTPVPSNTCFDEYRKCATHKEKMCKEHADKCKRTCGGCS